MSHHFLRFVAGKDQSREFVLPPDSIIVIGRVSDCDLLLLDEEVSRKHAMISTRNRKIIIEDLASKNGTLVNGAAVRSAELKTGDEIVIGRSTIRLVESGKQDTPAVASAASRPTFPNPAETQPIHPLFSGSIRAMPLPDILQLFVSSRKTGLLTIRSSHGTGKVYLRDGQVFFAEIEDKAMVWPLKAFYRIIGWMDGTFELRPLTQINVTEAIAESTTALVLEAMRQLDEIRILEPKLPRPGAKLAVAEPLPGSLRDLATEEVQLFQLALHHASVELIVDHFPGSDLEAYTCLLGLMRRGFLIVS
jgi:hypothetical protein